MGEPATSVPGRSADAAASYGRRAGRPGRHTRGRVWEVRPTCDEAVRRCSSEGIGLPVGRSRSLLDPRRVRIRRRGRRGSHDPAWPITNDHRRADRGAEDEAGARAGRASAPARARSRQAATQAPEGPGVSASGAGEAPLIAGKIQGVRGWSPLGRHAGRRRPGRRVGARTARRRARPAATRGVTSAPAKECGCGLYGTHPWAGGTQGEILGVIEAWGRVELHATGFRAEWARPIALFVVADETTLAEARALRRVAERYECELIELEARARDRGGVPSARLGPLARGRGGVGPGRGAASVTRRRPYVPGAARARGPGPRRADRVLGGVLFGRRLAWPTRRSGGSIGLGSPRRDHRLAPARVGLGRRDRSPRSSGRRM